MFLAAVVPIADVRAEPSETQCPNAQPKSAIVTRSRRPSSAHCGVITNGAERTIITSHQPVRLKKIKAQNYRWFAPCKRLCTASETHRCSPISFNRLRQTPGVRNKTQNPLSSYKYILSMSNGSEPIHCNVLHRYNRWDLRLGRVIDSEGSGEGQQPCTSILGMTERAVMTIRLLKKLTGFTYNRVSRESSQ